MRLNWIAIGAVWAAIGVAFGALGAHALKDRVTPEMLDIWRTGVLYHVLHALALVLYGLFRERRTAGAWPGQALLFGSLVFSFTLYGIVLGGPKMLGAVTPIGGVAMIAGWLGLAAQAIRDRGPK